MVWFSAWDPKKQFLITGCVFDRVSVGILHELTVVVDPKASWVDVWSGVLPENPRAGVLNCEAVGAAQDPNELGVKYGEYAPAAP